MTAVKNICYFKPERPGVFKMGKNNSPDGNGYSFAFNADKYIDNYKEIGVILYDKNLKMQKIPFSGQGKTGAVFGLCVFDINFEGISYNFYADDMIICDPFATSFFKNNEFGVYNEQDVRKASFESDDFDWGNDSNPQIPYEKSFFYGLNVRYFTMHKSSKVKNKGTFEGVCEKLNYIKELGATAIVLMPSYEFDECHQMKSGKRSEDNENISGIHNPKINCWGFTEGYYYAPKANYSASNNPKESFKNLVKNAHNNGIEVIMQFYFAPESYSGDIINILRYWVINYHIDGFRISGFNIPKKMIIDDPILKGSKLWFDYVSSDDISSIKEKPADRYVSSDNGQFRDIIRRFNKGDEGLINEVLRLLKINPSNIGLINYICDYDGFSLYDLYSYDRKHNEANGEENKDGNDANYSWNCGIEGETRKKNIIQCRKAQIKNALIYLFLGAATPYIYSGDEIGNTRFGNNNAYCQDNEIGYIKWKNTSETKEISEFIKSLIRLRFESRIFHMRYELKNLDVLSCGCPDLSYHGFEAWRPDLSFNSRTIGILYYGPGSGLKNASSFYVGINMHWENHRVAVPKLRKGDKLVKLIDTAIVESSSKDNEIPVPARSISIYEIENQINK